jgi:hypothetical protein
MMGRIVVKYQEQSNWVPVIAVALRMLGSNTIGCIKKWSQREGHIYVYD